MPPLQPNSVSKNATNSLGQTKSKYPIILSISANRIIQKDEQCVVSSLQQVNTVRGSGHITQGNSIYHHIPVADIGLNVPYSPPHSSSETTCRIEDHSRMRRRLEEVSTQPKYALSRIGRVALLATGILSVVEHENVSSTRLVDLAMDAHAVAYIVVISFLYRRIRMSRKRVDKLIELLHTIHAVLAEETAMGNIIVLFRKFLTRKQRKIRTMGTHEKLLHLLRKIESNDNADVISSLNAALDYHRQHNEVDAAE